MSDAPQSSFFFADLVGWTALTAERGDDHGAEVAVRFRRRVDALAGDCEREVKSLGDGVMVRCTEPASAIRLAVAVVDAAPVPARAGVHTGPAVARDGDWYGTTVNVAARLCSAAGGGEVLVSDAALRAAGDLEGLTVGEPRLHWLRNLREPVQAQTVEAPPSPSRLRRFARRLIPELGPAREALA